MAVSGTPGRGSVHVVEGVPALASGSVTVVNGVRVGSKLNIYVGKTLYALSFVVSVLTFVHLFSVGDPPWRNPCGCSSPRSPSTSTGCVYNFEILLSLVSFRVGIV